MHNPSDVPAGWKKFTLGALVKHAVSGPSPTCEERNIYGDREWGLLKTTAITWAGWDVSAHKALPAEYWGNGKIAVAVDDVVITKAGPRHRVGVVAHVDHIIPRIVVSGKMVLLRPNSVLVEPRILAGLLSQAAPQRFLDERTTGMAESQVNFSNSTLLKTPLLVPPMNQQRRIAEILDTIDDQITHSSATLRVLKQIETGLSEYLLHWRQGQEPPPGWHMRTFDEIAAAPICYGIVQAGPNCEGGIPVAMIRDLEAKLSGNLHRTRPSIEAAYSRSRIREGDLLVSIKGTIGRLCVVPEGFRGNISRDVARVRLTAHALPSFVAWLLSTKSGKELLESAVVGTTRSEVSIGILKKLPLPLPDIREQQKTLEIVSTVGDRIDVEQRRRRKFEIFKQGLMEDLLTGRVRVSDTEAVLENL